MVMTSRHSAVASLTDPIRLQCIFSRSPDILRAILPCHRQAVYTLRDRLVGNWGLARYKQNREHEIRVAG